MRTSSRHCAAWLRNHKRPTEAIADCVVWLLAVLLAGAIRFEFNIEAVPWTGAIYIGLLAGLTHFVIGRWMSLYDGRHAIGTHAEFRLLATIAVTVGLAGAFIAPLGVRAIGEVAPRSFGLIAGPLALVAMMVMRSEWRTLNEAWRRPDPAGRTSVVVIGAGDAGQQIVRAMVSDPRSAYVPVAVVDDDPRLRHRLIERIPVAGTTADLADVARTHDADLALIAIASASSERVREIVDLCEAAGLSVRILPRLSEMVGGRVGVKDIREVTIADLLQREQAVLDLGAISGYVRNRRVLVTGAGGSIGSELCRQLARFDPEALYMLDRDESALHSVQLSIDGQGQLAGDDLVLADIRDAAVVDAVFDRLRPDVVFHAAALKHVPILEVHVAEGIKTNILGTQNLLAASLRCGVDKFVNISTDKAADPENVLGFTKRTAERLTAAADDMADGDYISVRFGNVLGSRGSVLTAFQAQIEAGGPVTVTHEDVTRYFMTIEEAVSLVVQAGAIGRGGDVLVLDMGEPVRIADLARQVIAMSTRTEIEIVYTGLRPGERLHERLFSDTETDIERTHPQIWRTEVLPLPFEFTGDLLCGGEADCYAALRDRTLVRVGPALERTA